MDHLERLQKWLEICPLEDILDENDLSPAETLYILWCHGHLAIPMWLEVYDETCEEEDDEL